MQIWQFIFRKLRALNIKHDKTGSTDPFETVPSQLDGVLDALFELDPGLTAFDDTVRALTTPF